MQKWAKRVKVNEANKTSKANETSKANKTSEGRKRAKRAKRSKRTKRAKWAKRAKRAKLANRAKRAKRAKRTKMSEIQNETFLGDFQALWIYNLQAKYWPNLDQQIWQLARARVSRQGALVCLAFVVDRVVHIAPLRSSWECEEAERAEKISQLGNLAVYCQLEVRKDLRI